MNTPYDQNKPDYVKIARDIILSRYDDPEYKKGIESIIDPDNQNMHTIDPPHIVAVVEWVGTIWRNPPDALLIAAYGHDWERAWEDERDKEEDYSEGDKLFYDSWYMMHKEIHASNSANLLRRKIGQHIPIPLMMDVTHLVLRHEKGGERNRQGDLIPKQDAYTRLYDLNSAADVLNHADVLGFFDVLDLYVRIKPMDKVEQKIKWSLRRIKNEEIYRLISQMEYSEKLAIEAHRRFVLI
ncbi:hypothetical protein JW968_04435 [Candidatus Woesearchaeota archaeon]|nr:hypothetical protein [Candidatus Woesearchaeota archaeon]